MNRLEYLASRGDTQARAELDRLKARQNSAGMFGADTDIFLWSDGESLMTYGYGSGYGSWHGNGSGSGYGSWRGDGDGDGYGTGYGDGSGHGNGNSKGRSR